MLNLLVKYAYDHKLRAEPGFTRKDVQWGISFAADGRYLGVLRLSDLKKGRPFLSCPEFSFSELKYFARKQDGQEVGGAHFLVTECSNLVFLTNAGEEPDEKTRAKHQFFLGLLKQASIVIPELTKVAAALDNSVTLSQIRDDLLAKKATANNKATLHIAGRFIVDEETWHEWWRTYRTEINAEINELARRDETVAAKMVCLATGQVVTPARLHPKISGLSDVGGLAQSPFIGFDKKAFQSYGLNQSENGAVGIEAASAYREALNELLRNSEKLAGMRVAYWFNHDVPIENDPFALLLKPASNEQSELTAQQRARDLLQSIRSGLRTELATSKFYAVSLSGAQGRVMTRDWMDGAFEDLVVSVEQWFSDLEIVSYRETKEARSPGLERIITCLLLPQKIGQDSDKEKKEKWLKSIGTARLALWRAALNPSVSIPFIVISRLVPLHRAFVLSGELTRVEVSEPTNPADKKARNDAMLLLNIRMGLLKAYHNRQAKGGYRMQPYLNEDHPSPAYHCGRLMSVLARLQQAALGDVGAGVVQRYYGAASTTPALVLGRLARLSKYHLNSITSPGLAFWYENKLADIGGRLKDRIPSTLTLEEQSLFALGYYQQMAHDRAKKLSDQNTQGDNNV